MAVVSWLHPWAAPLLRCPEEGSPLEAREDHLVCAEGHTFAVRDRIPRFSGQEYAESFGFEWTTFHRTRFTHLSHEAADEIRDKLAVTPEEVNGRLVLEAGCGPGHHTSWMARWGAKVVAVDLSEAVEPAAANTRGSEVQVLQADLTRLPLAPESFDLVISNGVLHHTPDTRKSFESLVPLVKPSGRIAIWVYSTSSAYPGSEFLRRYTTRMQPERLLRLCRWASRTAPLYKIPGLRSALIQLLPVAHHADPEMRVLDTFDWYSPMYQWKHTYPEVFDWFAEAGLVDIRPLHVPVAVTGRKPGPVGA